MATATSTGSWLDPPELHGKRNSDGTFTLEELELKRLNDYNRKVAKMIKGGLNLANLNAAANQVFTDIQGNVTEVTVTAQGLESRVSSAEGNIVTAQQTASSASVTASNAAGQAASVALTVQGLGVTTQGGTTFITGDHVKTGTLEGVTLVTATDFYRTIIEQGWLQFLYGSYLYGSLSIQDATGRLVLSTSSGVALKLQSDSSMSIDANGTIYIGTSSGYSGDVNIGRSGGTVNLNGDVYINGVLQ